MNIDQLATATRNRLQRFDKIRGRTCESGTFWDIVVLTAVDEKQRNCYELQLKLKLEQNQLPLSPQYIVVADPVGPKIGNGGSTLIVINHLHGLYGEECWNKKVIIIHAGGFSQRLPNASFLGKAFTAIPYGEPMYQALELKLASHIDFPGKIAGGGIFVCCADCVEVYNDAYLPWNFSSEGFTAFAHRSPISIGTTHGVFILSEPLDSTGMVWRCKKFLHKPSIKEMMSTDNCVMTDPDKKNWVFTDSAFFISNNAAKQLLGYFCENQPLNCEIDAYGDFLQALGSDSSPNYIQNVKNVCVETTSLHHSREQIYNLLHEIPLYAVVLAPISTLLSKTENDVDTKRNSVNSIFYHFGTMSEYHHNFTVDKDFKTILALNPLSSCLGMPHVYTGMRSTENINHVDEINNKHRAVTCTIQHLDFKTPCIMASTIGANVILGEGTIVEYCNLNGSVEIGCGCIVSNCEVPIGSRLPDDTFMHTAVIDMANGNPEYVTIICSTADDLKKTVPSANDVPLLLTYFGIPLLDLFPHVVDKCTDQLSLWTARIFPGSPTMEESSRKACDALRRILQHSEDSGTGIALYKDDERLYSMKEILEQKNIKSMLGFRLKILSKVNAAKDSSHLAKNICAH